MRKVLEKGVSGATGAGKSDLTRSRAARSRISFPELCATRASHVEPSAGTESARITVPSAFRSRARRGYERRDRISPSSHATKVRSPGLPEKPFPEPAPVAVSPIVAGSPPESVSGTLSPVVALSPVCACSGLSAFSVSLSAPESLSRGAVPVRTVPPAFPASSRGVNTGYSRPPSERPSDVESASIARRAKRIA